MRLSLLLATVPFLALPAVALAPASGDCDRAVPVSAESLGIDVELLGPGPVDGHACWGRIQPGALMTNGCTMNWIVADEIGALYFGTAGHCAGRGSTVGIAGIGSVGRVVYGISQGIGRDFALVKIDRARYPLVDPTLCHWGGPSLPPLSSGVGGTVPLPRPYAFMPDPIGLGDPVQSGAALHYGWGVGTSQREETRARPAIATMYPGTALTIAGSASPGDSGSPIMFADGRPAGVITHAFFQDPPAVALPNGQIVDRPHTGTGAAFATRIDAALAFAGAAIGRDLHVVLSYTLPIVGATAGGA